MTTNMRRTLIVAILAGTLCPGSIQAALVTWTLDGVEFDDGGTATGKFVYDASNNAVMDWDIKSPGHNFGLFEIDFAKPSPFCDPTQPPLGCDSVQVSAGSSAGTIQIAFQRDGTPSASAFLTLAPAKPLSDLGGTITLIPGSGFGAPFSPNPTGSGFGCCEGFGAANLIAGSIGTVPEPLSLGFVAVGTLMLVTRLSLSKRRTSI